MTLKASRRAFLEARFGADTAIRPPGANNLRDRCTRCGDCAAGCEQAIIAADESGYPVLNFQRECTFCGACAAACETGALLVDLVPAWPWRAALNTSCFSMNGIDCRACQDECETNAIRFRLQAGGVAAPMLDQDICTGCGACAAVCPADAITFEKVENHMQEAV